MSVERRPYLVHTGTLDFTLAGLLPQAPGELHCIHRDREALGERSMATEGSLPAPGQEQL